MKEGDDEDGDVDGNAEWRLRQEVWVPRLFVLLSCFEVGFWWLGDWV